MKFVNDIIITIVNQHLLMDWRHYDIVSIIYEAARQSVGGARNVRIDLCIIAHATRV
jgi:hypothetical protein